MAVRGIFKLGLLLLVSACGDKSPTPDNGVQPADAPKRRVALQDLVDQKKISYATAVRCMYLAYSTKDQTDNSGRADRVRYNAKFYALQLMQDNPGKVEADVGIQSMQDSIAASVYGSDEEKQDAARRQGIENKKEFEAICVPVFLERQ